MEYVWPFPLFVIVFGVPIVVQCAVAFYINRSPRGAQQFNYSFLELIAVVTGLIPVAIRTSLTLTRANYYSILVALAFGVCALHGMLAAKLLYELKCESSNYRMAAIAIVIGAVTGNSFAMVVPAIYFALF